MVAMATDGKSEGLVGSIIKGNIFKFANINSWIIVGVRIVEYPELEIRIIGIMLLINIELCKI
jgi:hypothetical protein